MSGVYEDWNHLTVVEKIYLVTHPLNAARIKTSKNDAFQETSKRFGYNGHNDKTDAFRHCFWSAILARDIGYLDAWIYTTAHESDPKNPAGEKKMDLANNLVGLKIGKFCSLSDSNAELSNKCYEALQKGQLLTSP